MGLLDDAIREHLELKRLRGADPGEVAREENDALGPVRREVDALAPEHDPIVAGVGQETVEINMDAELGGEPEAAEAPAPPAGGRAFPVGHPAHTQPSAGDSLEWEMPADRKADADGEGSAEDEQESGEEAVEDVLEETPDFLRETPEQDRLWFEQRPPRDFDFNE